MADYELRTFGPAERLTLARLLGEWRTAQREWEVARSSDGSDVDVALRRVAAAWVAYQDAVDAFPGAMLLVADDEGRYLAANRRAVEMLGHDIAGLADLPLVDLAGGDLGGGGLAAVSHDLWRDFLDVGVARGSFPLWTRTGRWVDVDYEGHARWPVAALHISVLTPRP